MRLLTTLCCILLFISCGEDESTSATPNNGNNNTGIRVRSTNWLVTEMVNRANPVITSDNATSLNINFLLNQNGTYLTDNFINECGGRFNTDEKLAIDFEERINCTNTCCDPIEYDVFKDILTKDVTVFAVNTDTTRLTLSRDGNTYIRLQRVK